MGTDATRCAICGGEFSAKRVHIDGGQYHPRCAIMSGPSAAQERDHLAGQCETLLLENTKLRALLNDKGYLQMKADYNKGHLSYFNTLQSRESGLHL